LFQVNATVGVWRRCRGCRGIEPDNVPEGLTHWPRSPYCCMHNVSKNTLCCHHMVRKPMSLQMLELALLDSCYVHTQVQHQDHSAWCSSHIGLLMDRELQWCCAVLVLSNLMLMFIVSPKDKSKTFAAHCPWPRLAHCHCKSCEISSFK